MSNEAPALKGGEAVPVGDWSEAETLERIGREVATCFYGSGRKTRMNFFFGFLFSKETAAASSRACACTRALNAVLIF
jgi:hypothetical protein